MTDPQVYGSSWYAATMAAAPERAPLTFDLDVDVCVIGGGLAGLTTAREVARRGWSVVLLEAQRLAWNASGRNDGFVLPGFHEHIGEIIARVGLDHAKSLWKLSEMGVEYIRETLAETAMPGVAPAAGWLVVSKTDQNDDLLALARLLREQFAADVESWPVEQVRAALKSASYFHAVHYPRAFSIHPLNYALGLAAAAEQAGAKIFEQTPAVSIDPAGVRKRVTTPSARVRAGHVVLAGNTHLRGLMPKLAQTLLPISTYVITTAPLGDRIKEAVTTTAAVSDGARADNHYRVIGGDRLLWSGRVTTWNGNARRFAGALRADIARVYPQLGEVEVEYAWSGTIGRSVHRMPQIGELARGLWVASGFGGHGLNTTAMAGSIIARAITEADDTWRLFSPYELVWAGGVVGRAVAQGSYWAIRLGEQTAARLARRREQQRLGETPGAAARKQSKTEAREPRLADAPGEGAAPPQPVEARPVVAAEPTVVAQMASRAGRNAKRSSVG
jgi:gamma-glutamylputrescine oxidase